MPVDTINLHDEKNYKYISQRSMNENWTLCVGAGICVGILPTWNELTLNLINEIFSYSWNNNDFIKANKQIGFSLDSWIQGCLNHHVNINGKTRESFNELLEKVLYKDLLNKAKEQNISNEIKKIFEKPNSLTKDEINIICTFFDTYYSNTTLLKLVKVLTKNINEIKLPQSIITLNADSLLPSLLRIYQMKYFYEENEKADQPAELFVKITNPYNKWGNKIPIFQLHGTISPTLNEKIEDNRKNLIFLEDSYNEIASNIHSWAQSTFLYTAQNNKMIFVGLSMTDQNLRKWLGWINTVNFNEIKSIKPSTNISLQHLWITTKKNTEIQRFLNVSMNHLGIKLALINSWSNIDDRLKYILTT